jgi:hypothetical protein
MNTQTIMLVQALDGGSAMALAMLVIATFARSAASAPRNQDQRLVIGLAIAIAAWFGISSGMATAGDFSAANGAFALPLLGLSLLGPLAIGVPVVLLAAPIRQLVSQRAVQPTVIAVHSLRVIEGSAFLLMAALAVLPAIFAIPAGAGDVIAGLAAFSASRWLRAGRWGRVVAWNLFGVLDLLNAAVLGVVTSPGQLNLLHATPTSAWLLVEPLVVIPTFVVPFYLLLHFVSLRYLVSVRNQERQVAPAARMEVSA